MGNRYSRTLVAIDHALCVGRHQNTSQIVTLDNYSIPKHPSQYLFLYVLYNQNYGSYETKLCLFMSIKTGYGVSVAVVLTFWFDLLE